MVKNELLKKPDTRASQLRAWRLRKIILELVLSDTYYIDNNEPLKLHDTRSVQHEPRVQSGCAAERTPRYGSGGSPGHGNQFSKII